MKTKTKRPLALETLHKRAQMAANALGHAVKWRQVFGRANGPKSQFGQCRHCNMEVLIAEGDSPIDMSGEAINKRCPGHEFLEL